MSKFTDKYMDKETADNLVGRIFNWKWSTAKRYNKDPEFKADLDELEWLEGHLNDVIRSRANSLMIRISKKYELEKSDEIGDAIQTWENNNCKGPLDPKLAEDVYYSKVKIA